MHPLATAGVVSPNSVTIAVLIARPATASLSVSRAFIASQNQRWSVAATGTPW
ncbi:MAG: hypothetical protein ACYCV4_00645 [Dermatophilaceae bacterium]